MAAKGSKQPLELTAPQAQAVQSALQEWSKVKLITPDLVSDLRATIQVVEEQHTFDWHNSAKYAFRLSIICFVIAVVSIIAGNILPWIIERLLELPVALRLVVTVAIALAVHTWGYQRSLAKPEDRNLNEAIHCFGAFIFGLAALQLAHHLKCKRTINRHRRHRIAISLASTYGLIAVLVKSNFIWSCGMILLAYWFSATPRSILGRYDVGPLYPIHFVILGMAMIFVAYRMRYSRHTMELWSTTRIWGMLYLFVALSVLSLYDGDDIFYSSYNDHQRLLGGVLFWSFTTLFAAAFSVWHGLKFRDSTTKGFGLAFLGINLFTKFFEVFWDASYRPVFFTVLALLLGLLGRYAERMNILLQEQHSKLPA
ncbi:hypothetical protein F4677DRAFT_102151 [Hypoxylon crocopeplum]|nr:hypothetical protein F4677DRAFT_102151 [Hypoxylon crocopeplum]